MFEAPACFLSRYLLDGGRKSSCIHRGAHLPDFPIITFLTEKCFYQKSNFKYSNFLLQNI